MTTTVTIRHDGPNSHDVLVTPVGSATSQQHPARLHEGDSLTVYFWGQGGYIITEVEKEKQQ